MGSRLPSWLTRTFGANVRRREGFVADVRNALALASRGGVFRDTLRLEAVATQMQVTWTARPLHPWDRDLPAFEQDEAFGSQCLQDVDTAISRLFERFELVTSLDVVVLHPVSRTSILAGCVQRHEFAGASRLSIPMRLKMVGLQPTRCA
jgi:hypothetical protein